MIKNGRLFNQIAIAISGTLEYLEDYRRYNKKEDLYMAVWIVAAYLIDKVSLCHMRMNANIRLLVNKKRITMYYGEALHRTLGKIEEYIEKLPEEQQNILCDIMEKKEAFYEMDRKIPQNVKERYKNNHNYVNYQFSGEN